MTCLCVLTCAICLTVAAWFMWPLNFIEWLVGSFIAIAVFASLDTKPTSGQGG